MVIELGISAISNEGNGVGRHEGLVVFVPKTAIGDHIKAKIVQVRSGFAYGRIEEILQPSPARIENDCPAFERCGGCSLRHINYEDELREKSGGLEDNMQRIAGVHIKPAPPIASPQVDRYRNKAQFPVRMVNGELRAGFFAKRSHDLIPVSDCKLQPECYGDIVEAVLAFMRENAIPAYNETENSGCVRHIFIRSGVKTGEIMVCLVVRQEGLIDGDKLTQALLAACPAISTICVDLNRERTNIIFGYKLRVLYGPGFITEEICGLRIDISPYAFFQVNPRAAQVLYTEAAIYARPEPHDILLDLYCGTGTIGLSMARSVAKVIGVEVLPQAVEDAEKNARKNHISNARFICADVQQAVKTLQDEQIQPDIIVLDPPRKGVDMDVIEAVGAFLPRKIVYISCNSATFARDCKHFAELGFSVEKLCAIDLFPRTAHVESLALLTRRIDV